MKSGSTATRRAASPEPILCSAHTTPPLPQRSIRPPVRNAGRRSRSAMRGAPRAFHPREEDRPRATRYRAEAIVNGGIVSSAKRIARYVEPQTT